MASETTRKPPALEFRPDIAQVASRWAAFYAGDIFDRPILMVQAPKAGAPAMKPITYHDRVFGDIDEIIDRSIEQARWTYYGGEALPVMNMSFGTDEIGVFCGTDTLHWNEQSGDTNWSHPWVDDWEQALPLRIHEDNPLWQRMVRFYRRAAERTAGKMLLGQLDTHTNMDLLMSLRGSERLCMDLADQPETIDRAMASARAVFPKIWDMMRTEGRMDHTGYSGGGFSMDGSAVLQCDFSCMISGDMFRRWVIPALEEEAAIVKHAFYHWDGPGALRHLDDLAATKGLHTLAYVPGDGNDRPVGFIELHKKVQALGKASFAWGTPDEIKTMHRHLKPNKMLYYCTADSEQEARQLEEWLVRNT